MRRVEAARPLRLANAAFASSTALNRFARAWLAAYGGRKQALGLLDFDDLIDRARALLELPGHRRLGALAARRRPRPHPGRRGAGHEPGAVAGDRGDLGRVLRRRRRPRRHPHDLRRRRREAVDLQLPGRRSGRVRRQAARTTSGCWPRSARSCSAATCSTRSARRGRSSRWSTRSSRGPAGAGLAGRRSPTMLSTPTSPAASSSGRSCRSRRSRTRALGPAGRRPRPRRPGRASWPAASPREIAGWLGEPPRAARRPDGRAIRAGDVMILVQRRADLFDAIIRALKRARGAGRRRRPAAHRRRARGQRPARGAARRRDPGRRPLARGAAAQPARRHLRARALRARASAARARLWPALRAEPPGRWPEVRALRRRPAGAGRLPAARSSCSTRILVRHDGRRKLVARLGAEAEDGIDALLDQALAYESVEAPSLTGFLDWIDRDEVEVKRRSDEGADQVRVMTVHGAKGLEAPIVILPDTAVRHGRRATRRRSCASPTASRSGGCRAEDAPPALRRRRGGAPRAGPGREPPAALRRADPGQDPG